MQMFKDLLPETSEYLDIPNAFPFLISVRIWDATEPWKGNKQIWSHHKNIKHIIYKEEIYYKEKGIQTVRTMISQLNAREKENICSIKRKEKTNLRHSFLKSYHMYMYIQRISFSGS